MTGRGPDDEGFSLVELLVAMGLFLLAMSTIFELMRPSQGAFRVELERADVQQRTRAAVDALARDIRAVGSGTDLGADSGPLTNFLAPVLPYRIGRRTPDPPGTFKPDTITLLNADDRNAQTTIAQSLGAGSGVVRINADRGCPIASTTCGLASGTMALVFDGTGARDLFTVSTAEDGLLTLVHNSRDSSTTYAANRSHIVAASSRTYYLKTDPRNDAYQLMRYDGGSGADVPVVDHVVGLSFDYFGDPMPPLMLRVIADSGGPWTTYGPTPPAADVQVSAYPPGENCVFSLDASAAFAPRLAVFDPDGEGLVPLAPRQLVDGPWCPDAASPERYDADLFRIRRIGVVIRLESAVTAFRGPAGPLFTRGGTARRGAAFVPDHEVRLEIAPRNLQRSR